MFDSWSEDSSDVLGTAGNEREYDRYEWDHWVHVCWIRHSIISDPLVVGTTDLSAGGIGMACPNMVHTGTNGVVMLVGAARQLKVHYIEVIHCRYLTGSMLYLVGARWIGEPLGLPEHKAIMTPAGPRIVAARTRSRPESLRRPRTPAFIASQSQSDLTEADGGA